MKKSLTHYLIILMTVLLVASLIIGLYLSSNISSANSGDYFFEDKKTSHISFDGHR